MHSPQNLPPYPAMVELRPGHRDVLEEALAKADPCISELTFAYLWLWQPYTSCRLSRFRDELVIICRSAKTGESYAFAPLCETEKESAHLIPELLRADGPVTRCARVPDDIAEHLKRSPDLQLTATRGRADYVHHAEDLRELPGTSFHAKRNQIRQFKKACPDAQYHPVNPNLAARCSEFCQRWLEEHPKNEVNSLQREVETTRRMLNHMEWLRISGGALLHKGEVIAFALGEPLTDSTFIERVEKADTSYPGSYQAINRAFARHVASGYEWINREQDMGVRGLRRAKKSYNPHHLIRKYEIELSGQK